MYKEGICNEILFSHEKERNPVICGNIDEPCGHCAKLNKSDKEIQKKKMFM